MVKIGEKFGFELNETQLKENQIKYSKELASLASKSY
jgi:hypothetical protein